MTENIKKCIHDFFLPENITKNNVVISKLYKCKKCNKSQIYDLPKPEYLEPIEKKSCEFCNRELRFFYDNGTYYCHNEQCPLRFKTII